MGKKYALLQRKVENLESQLIPILTTPPDPETRPAHHPIPEGINQQLLFISNLLTTEIALSPASDEAHRCHLAQIACRVRLLQSTLRKWAGAHPTSALIEPRNASVCSCSESCLADEDEDEDEGEDVEEDDHGEAEESPMLGFTVYDNPEFFGTFDCDVHDDDDYLEFGDGDKSHGDHQNDVEVYDSFNQEEEEEQEAIEIDNHKEESREKTEDKEKDNMEEYEGIDEEEEQEKIRVRAEKEERSETADEDEEREHNCCFRVIFGAIMIVMGFIFLMIGFSDFSDHHQPVVFLTPT